MKLYFDEVRDERGNVLAGVSVTVMTCGVTAPLPAIYNEAGVQIANPIITDALGRFAFYAPDGNYDLRFDGAGVVTYTLQRVNLLDGGVSYPSPALGTVRSVSLGLPACFQTSGPVTDSGTLTGSLAPTSTAPNLFLASPTTGTGAWSLRSLVAADLPDSGASAGSYGTATQVPVLQVTAKGQVTGVTLTTITPAFNSITGKPSTRDGYGITDVEKVLYAFTGAPVGPINSALETSLFSGAVTIPANALTVGKAVAVDLEGFYDANNAATLTFRLKLAGSTLLTITTGTVPSATSRSFRLTAMLAPATTGATGTLYKAMIPTLESSGVTLTAQDPATSTVNTTTSNALDVTAQWSAAAAANAIKIVSAKVRML